MKYKVTVVTSGSGGVIEVDAADEAEARSKALAKAGEGYEVQNVESV